MKDWCLFQDHRDQRPERGGRPPREDRQPPRHLRRRGIELDAACTE